MSALGRILLCVVAVLAAASAAQANHHGHEHAKPYACHNITGTCLSQGFHCANDQIVPFSKRCDGVDDCADGTDEFLCDHPDHRPLHERTEEERHAHEQASCVNCACFSASITITSGPWWPFALVAPTDSIGLMTGAAATYGGMPCNSKCTNGIRLGFYKKTGVCRGWLCCARQRECTSCATGTGCNSPQVIIGKRCYSN